MFEKIAVIRSSQAPPVGFLPEDAEVIESIAADPKAFRAAIDKVARVKGVSLVILVTEEGESREEEYLMRALKKLDCPIWDHHSRKEDPIERIVATINPFRPPREVERLENRILHVADELKSWLSAELFVAHAWKAPAEGRVRTRMKEIHLDATLTDVEPSIRADVFKTVQKAGLDLPEENICLSHGSPARTLPACVQSLQADLVVAGYSARKPLIRSFVRNTALGLLPEFQSDLVLVRPKRS